MTLAVELLQGLKRADVVRGKEGVSVGTSSRGVEINLNYEQAQRLAEVLLQHPPGES